MHNPLALLTQELLDSLLNEGNLYFVRQAYHRGMVVDKPGFKAAFLFSYYSNKEAAERHCKTLVNDHYADLYDATIPEQKERLYKAASQPAGYKIYISMLKDKEWKPTEELIPKIKRYMSSLGWKPGRGDKVFIDIFIEFGEIFLTLKSRRDKAKVKLSDIERR